MRKGESNKGSAKPTISLHKKSASPVTVPAMPMCNIGGEDGTDNCHQDIDSARPSKKALTRSAGNSAAVNGMKKIENTNRATWMTSPTRGEPFRAAYNASPSTSGSRNAQKAPTAMPTTWEANATGKSTERSSSTVWMIHTCQRGSTANGTRMPLSSPSVWILGFCRCMTIKRPTTAGSSDTKQVTVLKYKRAAAVAAWIPSSNAAKCGVPISYSSE
mmetsp:Transcript_43226/g.119526  ORF Transcript_43226/g.119526 Transcript_43226/m.119526 type:complete len:217 (+) Transcript_43226:240-890(+)